METAMPYVPREVVVSLILPRLPIASLLRFRCVCKAWRDTINDDSSFHRTHLRLQHQQHSSVLVVLHDNMHRKPRDREVTTAGVYRLEEVQRKDVIMVHTMSYHNSFTTPGIAHDFAHCDGLVLLPMSTTVRVLNPATGRFVTFSWGTRSVRPDGLPRGRQASFGLGHDPGSNTYKVARFFYRSKNDFGVEVFTIGGEHRWRQIAARTPCPVGPGQTATFLKGSLIWIIVGEIRRDVPAFIRFSLEDESFSVMAPPPCCNLSLEYAAISLGEIERGLCVCVPREQENGYWSIEMWMCSDIGNNNVPPQWDRRYVLAIRSSFRWYSYRSLRLVGVFNEQIMLRDDEYSLLFYKKSHGVRKGAKSIMNLKFHDPKTNRLVTYRRENLVGCDAIPYVPSLLQV